MKNFLTILTFCSLTASFSVLGIGLALDNHSDNVYTKLFALFFVISCVSFLGYLKALNKRG
jgi:hypothetical protein